MQIIPIIFCSIAAPIAFLLLTYWMDRKQPEPLPQLLKAVTLGGVVALLSLSFTAVLNNAEWIYVGDITSWSHFKQAFFGAAFPEEASKLIMLYILLKNNKYFDEFFDGIVYAVFIAMGFASVENICYALTNPEGWQAVLVGRSILSVPAHFCYAVVMGACFSCWHFKGIKSYSWLAAGAPFIMHALFDFCLNEITPSNGTASMIGILVVFALLLSVMATFAYRGIAETTKLDEYLRNLERQYAWRNRHIRHYAIILLTLCSTVMFSSGTKTNTAEPTNYELSKELKEFRDVFCIPMRKAYNSVLNNHFDAQQFYNAVKKATPGYSRRLFKEGGVFLMIDNRVKLDTTFTGLTQLSPTALAPLGKHPKFSPLAARAMADSIPDHAVAPGFWYEIIHQINEFSTDGSAAVTQLPVLRCYHKVLKANSTALFNFETFGKQEILLVGEAGETIDLSLVDKTTKQCYTAETKEGASWIVWPMNRYGLCTITLHNHSPKDLSFVLVNHEIQE